MTISGLTIRPFVAGQDEQVWVDITNRTWQEDEDFTPTSVEDLKRWDDAPWVGVRTRLLAELDGVPVAKVWAETDKTRTELKALVTCPDVLPEHRRKGIGTALMTKALASLHDAGMESAEVSAFDSPASNGFLEALGFRIVRRFCLMRRSLTDVPSSVGETRDIEVVTLGRTDEDIDMLRRLHNEAFKEHFNYAPDTLDNWKYIVKKWDERGRIGFVTVAKVAGQPAGYLLYGIDPKDNEYLKKKRGGLWDVGVLKQFRGRGIAKRLMIDAMKHLRREGMEEAQLGVDETNVTNAMELYERLGFAVARRRLVWNKRLCRPPS
ncbi:MAG TPA: GNAT family N-acetyltransferase [bacterium]|nr:GNAT family N-acetyltransferase [bacterium]